MIYLAIFIGGGLGSLARFGLSKFNGEVNSNWVTFGTFLANMISCFILGYVVAYSIKNGLSDNLKILLITGFCGGFSTFSTFSYELFTFVQRGSYSMAVIYLLTSVFFGLLMIILGIKIAP